MLDDRVLRLLAVIAVVLGIALAVMNRVTTILSRVTGVEDHFVLSLLLSAGVALVVGVIVGSIVGALFRRHARRAAR